MLRILSKIKVNFLIIVLGCIINNTCSEKDVYEELYREEFGIHKAVFKRHANIEVDSLQITEDRILVSICDNNLQPRTRLFLIVKEDGGIEKISSRLNSEHMLNKILNEFSIQTDQNEVITKTIEEVLVWFTYSDDDDCSFKFKVYSTKMGKYSFISCYGDSIILDSSLNIVKYVSTNRKRI